MYSDWLLGLVRVSFILGWVLFMKILFWFGVVASSILLIVVGVFLVPEPEPVVVYDETWCEAMMLKPNPDWVEQEILAFSQHCLVE